MPLMSDTVLPADAGKCLMGLPADEAAAQIWKDQMKVALDLYQISLPHERISHSIRF